MKSKNLEKMAFLSMLSAIIVILQFVSGLFPTPSGISISLVMIPIVIGAAIYGPKEGAFLGAFFGVAVILGYFCGIGSDNPYWIGNPLLTVIVCIIKGACAGFVSGLLFKLINKSKTNKSKIIGAYIASAVCPVINTGLFLVANYTIFKDVLITMAGGTNTFVFFVTILAGFNFLIEFSVSIIFAPAIIRILDATSIGKK